jgi:uncharacterized protein (DUF169 family)
MTTLDPKAVAQLLDQHLRTDTFPLAIRVLKAGEPIPAKARRPKAEMGIQVSICQGISMARRYGWSVAMGAEDLICPIAQVAFGFKQPIPFYEEGNLAAGMYVETCAQGKLTEQEVPKFTADEAGTVVVAPLARCNFEPETLLFYGNSAQVMRAVTAALWKTGGSLTATSSGRADCADIVIRTAKEGKPQFILPCLGDRIFGQVQDHEMAFTTPWRLLPDLLEGLEGTHKGGVRYPIPNFLRYTPQFPPTYQELQRLWDEQEEAEQ